MNFSAQDQVTWARLFQRLTECRAQAAHPLFVSGLNRLGIDGERIPELQAVNSRLFNLTGWRGVWVAGLEGPKEFFSALARREFPVGRFIRAGDDLDYTPAPDVFHDLYGHLPLLADRDYADYCAAFGSSAMQYGEQPTKLRQFERFFWFGVEFPLIETPKGRRIFGGGILSSYGESRFCLSPEPQVLPFDIEAMRLREFKIDEFQKQLFLLRSPEQLYGSLSSLAAAVAGGSV